METLSLWKKVSAVILLCAAMPLAARAQNTFTTLVTF